MAAGGAIDYSKFNDLDGADEDELDKLTEGLQEENKALREHGLSKIMEEAERSVRQGLEDGPDKLSPDIMAEVEKDDDSAWLTVLGAMYISCGSIFSSSKSHFKHDPQRGPWSRNS